MSTEDAEDGASVTLVPSEGEMAEYTELIKRSRDERRSVAELLAESARQREAARAARVRAAEVRQRLQEEE